MDTWITTFITVISILLVFSIVGNVATVLVVVRDKRMVSLTNVLMCNLAISDIMLSGIVIPAQLRQITDTVHFTDREY